MPHLPDFPWDSLVPVAERARANGLIDLSVGSPVDPTPDVVRDALARATDAHGYPLTSGSAALRDAVVAWAARRGAPDLRAAEVLPTIGSKEFVAGLPLWLGLGPGDTVVHPAVAYPTYAVGAALVGATALAEDDPAAWPDSTRLVWLNSPGNPDGAVLDVPALRAAIGRARELGAVIANDECYADFGWDDPWSTGPTPGVLDPRVTDGDRRGVLAVHSLSKRSNLAGYRAGFVTGCAETIARVLAVRKHLGLIPPAPVQHAMIAALADDEHVSRQRERYRARRSVLAPALERAGFRIDRSEAGLYLWASRAGEDAWQAAYSLADLGLLVAPGTFYGDRGAHHVRVALTASDDDVAEAARRLRASPSVSPLASSSNGSGSESSGTTVVPAAT